MRQNLFAWLIGILVLTLVAGYIDLSDSVGVGDVKRATPIRLGLDLKGGLQLVLQAEPRGQNPVTDEQLGAARNIIEDRVSGLGASEPVVQTAQGNRILVEMPGIENLEEATSIVQETAFLEYIDGGSSPPAVGSFVCTSEGCPKPEQLSAAKSTITSTKNLPVFKTVVTGEEIDGSKVAVAFDQAGLPDVSFTLKGAGPDKLKNFTAANVGKYMPIVLDKKVISSPVLQSAIPGGQGRITGLSLSEAKSLSLQLKYGALPVSLTPIESRKISATLGQEAVDKSIVAGIIGLGLVVLFMIIYYRLPGVLASLALIVYAAVTLAIFKLVPVTLTLAGIAGFILSIGMAVDANVLIFSRLKEELRSGKTLGAAVEAGFDHAWPSIRDSNASTLITCAILFWFGSTFGGASIIKGFALTLAIGVAVSLFSAITVSRTFLRAVVNTPMGRSRWAFMLDDKRSSTAAATTEIS